VIFLALEERFKAAVFLDGDFFIMPSLPARDRGEFRRAFENPCVDGKRPVRFFISNLSFSNADAEDDRNTRVGQKTVLTDTPLDVSQ